MLELQSVDFSYKLPVKVIANVSLSINSGEFLAIAGRNGSGKTTLTRLMMGLQKPSGGKILFQGNDTIRRTPADMARHIGYVFQNPDCQIFRDTVAAETAYGPEQLGYSPRQVKDFVTAALELTGLAPLADCYPFSLSKGQKQRLAIASALAMQPQTLILDEPASGQDARERLQLLQLLTTLHQLGKTIVMITHDMELLARYAHRVIVMDQGCKVFDGSQAELFTRTDCLKLWGLSEPAAAKISRLLSSCKIGQTSDLDLLVRQITEQLRRNGYAKTGTAY